MSWPAKEETIDAIARFSGIHIPVNRLVLDQCSNLTEQLDIILQPVRTGS